MEVQLSFSVLESAIRVQNLDEAVCITLRANK